MGAHARLGPSNHRWPHCPGSVREEANYPDIPGEAAIDGTGSHLLLEMCLDNNVSAIQYDQQIIGANHPDRVGGWLVGTERIERVQMCLDYITRRVQELGAQYQNSTVTVESETKANPGGYYLRKDWWGTVDITITCCDQKGNVLFLEVIDYKDGRGWVDVHDNTQLLSYLGGKMRPHIGSGPELVRPFRTERIGDCRMTIVQPKTNPVVRYQCSTGVDDWLSPEYVMEKLDELSDAANATDCPDAPCVRGKHCQWCKANPKRGGHCVTATEESIKVVTDMSNTDISQTGKLPMFEQISKVVADPKSLTSDQLSELLSAKDAFIAAFDKCESEIKERIEAGESVNGYAMQPGRTSRKWNESEEDIVKKLKSRRLKLDDIYPKKLISPAELLKSDKLTAVQKKKIEEELITNVVGKLILKKVTHSVAQSSTDATIAINEMFAEVPATSQPEPAVNGDEISFF